MKPSKKLLRAIVCLLIGLSIAAPCAAQTPAEAAKDRWVAHVTSVQGGVYIQHAGKSQWKTLKVADRCYPGDSIRVDENSRAALLFKNDSTLRVDQNSHLTFQPMEEQTILMRLFKGAACFFSRFPRSLKIFTPHMNGTVKGTEFVIRVDGDETQLTLFEGQVLAENEKGEFLLVSGQSIVAKKGQAPVFVTVVRPRDAVQWALYYPAIQDFSPGDFPGEADWLVKSRVSVEAWRKGDHAGALGVLKEVRDEGVVDTHYLLYRASLALSVGQIDDASAYLVRTLKTDPENANAYALQSIIATTQNNKVAGMDLATKAVNLDPQSSAARIALSYAQQAHLEDLNGAMASTQEAVKLSPSDAYARARLAELWLAQGYLKRALEEAQRAVQINPHIARTQVVLGYAYLTQVEIDKSRAAFEKAIALDSADPLPRLGLGLAKIRKGDLEEGRQEIEIAASLDVNNALIRSYLGKAYYEEKRESLSATQFATAKQLDPMDPTPWFYDAILKQSVNQPVEALHDLQKSIELNDNRAVYRSRLLLDSDLAARSASIARIYTDLGFQQRALVEGWNSLNTDPANYSAHRFLADSYSARPRHEIARVSELLQSQLLQPSNINPIQPRLAESNLALMSAGGPGTLSFNEFNPLFNRDRIAFQGSLLGGENSTYGGEGVISGIYKKASFSMGYTGFDTDGWKENAEQKDKIANAFLQLELSPQTSIQAEYRYRDNLREDVKLNFFKDNDLPFFRFENQVHSVRVGGRHAFSPSSILIGNFQYSDSDSDRKDRFFFDPAAFGLTPPPIMNFIDYSWKDDAFSGELSHLYRSKYVDIVSGVGAFRINKNILYTDSLYWPGETPPLFLGTFHSSQNVDINHYNLYLYSYIKPLRNLTLTFGASGDLYKSDDEHVDEQDLDKKRFNPKFGVTWIPFDGTTLRGAVFRTLKRTLITDQTLEPTQVAGFNQFFDDVDASEAWVYSAGVDQKFSEKIYAGAEFFIRDLKVPYYSAVGATPVLGEANWNDYLGRAYLYWTPHKWLAFRAEYGYEKSKYADVVNLGAKEVETHSVPLGVNFFHPSGMFAGLQATYYYQSGVFWRYAAATLESGDDKFWLVDALIGYRLPKRYGILSVGVTNLFDKEFEYFEVDLKNSRIKPARQVFCRITFALP